MLRKRIIARKIRQVAVRIYKPVKALVDLVNAYQEVYADGHCTETEHLRLQKLARELLLSLQQAQPSVKLVEEEIEPEREVEEEVPDEVEPPKEVPISTLQEDKIEKVEEEEEDEPATQEDKGESTQEILQEGIFEAPKPPAFPKEPKKSRWSKK